MNMTFKMPPMTHCALTYNYDTGGAASSELAAHPPYCSVFPPEEKEFPWQLCA